MTTHTIILEFEIHDEEAFRRAASERAQADGIEPDEAASYLDAEQRSIGACAGMIFDPGMSPAGCSILGSYSD